MNLSHLVFLNANRTGIPWTNVPHKNLDLAFGLLRGDESVIACRDLDPVHANDLRVDHEPQGIRDVAFKSWNNSTEHILVRTLTPFEDPCGKIRSRHLGSLDCTYLEP